jgi:hypothetical protein
MESCKMGVLHDKKSNTHIGNRTRVSSLEGRRSTTILCARGLIFYFVLCVLLCMCVYNTVFKP